MRINTIESIVNTAVLTLTLAVQLYHLFVFYTHKHQSNKHLRSILINQETFQSSRTTTTSDHQSAKNSYTTT